MALHCKEKLKQCFGGKKMANFIVVVNWVLYYAAMIALCFYFGYTVGYVSSSNDCICSWAGSGNQTGNMDAVAPGKDLTDQQTHWLGILGVMIAAYLVFQGAMNAFLTIAVKEVNTRILMIWIIVSWLALVIDISYFCYQVALVGASCYAISVRDGIFLLYTAWDLASIGGIMYFLRNVLSTRRKDSAEDISKSAMAMTFRATESDSENPAFVKYINPPGPPLHSLQDLIDSYEEDWD